MMKRTILCATAGGMLLLSGCGKKEIVSPPEGVLAEAGAVAEAPPAFATHLGFAVRVPKEADLYVTGKGLGKIAELFLVEETLQEGTVAGMEPDPDTPSAIDEAKMYIGEEAFLFVGPGAGMQFQMVGKTYRDFSAAWAGFAVDSILKLSTGGDAEADFESLAKQSLADHLSDDLLGKWLDVIEKDSQFQIPSLVVGWMPDESKLEECKEAVLEGVDDLFKDFENAVPVAFESGGAKMEGYEIDGGELFGEGIEQAREELKNQTGAEDLPEALTPERIERLLAAAENLRLTVAAGTVDGRVVIYLGNGKDGFKLAATPAESLAATEHLKWTHPFSGNPLVAFAYLSKPMIGAILPWLDTSDFWEALAGVVQDPIREKRAIRELLGGIADSTRQLAVRDACAWSAILVKDTGWRFESRGGWPDPSLDYQTSFTMADAALAQNPAVRAHWVQNRERNDLEWKLLEHFGALVEAAMAEFGDSGENMMDIVPKEATYRLITEMRSLNKAYRDEFRAGIGDEVAFVADFDGEVPPIPGISEETIRDFRAPRFIYARTVRDRAMLDAAGASYGKSWRSLTAWACELSGEKLPLINPQKIESGGLVTWFPPLPFIGGDFIPGVTMNDRLWMLGTSQSMAKGFAKSIETSDANAETGMRIEIDFAPFREWGQELYQMNEDAADALAEDVPDEVQDFASEQNLERLQDAAEQLKGLSFRKWMEDGTPRTQLHLQTSEAK